MNNVCHTCKGKGRDAVHVCPHCHGSGRERPVAHRLVVLDGTLYFPTGGLDANLEHNAPSMLMRFYDAGDMDTCPWPFDMTNTDLTVRLARALYDERETNDTWKIGDTVELPDGQPFDFDVLLIANESPDYDPAQSPRK